MARHLVPLTWRSIGQSFSKRAQVAASAWTALWVVGAGFALILVALYLLRDVNEATDQLLRGILVIVIGVGCFVTGAITHPVDPLDERAVVFAGRTPARAAWGTLIAGLFTPAPLLILGLAVVFTLMSMPGAEPWLLAASAASLGVVWLLLARLGIRAGRGMSGHRWGREFSAISIYLVVLLAAPVGFALMYLPWQDAVDTGAAAISGAMHLVPPVSVLFVQDFATPLQPYLVTGALILVLLILELSLGIGAARRAMRFVSAGGVTRPGLFRGATQSAARAISARIWLAWLRDGRYALVLITVIVLPFLLVIPLATGGLELPWLALLPVPMFAFLLGWALHNDTAYDSTALWLHVTSGMRGIVDRVGRATPTLIAGFVIVCLGGLATFWFTGEPLYGVTTVGVSLALLGATVGGSSIMSAWFPYPVAKPGESPFTQPVRSWGSALVAHPVAGLIEIALCAPVIWLALQAVWGTDWSLAWATLGIGVASGAVLALIGLYLGGWVFQRRSWKILEFLQGY